LPRGRSRRESRFSGGAFRREADDNPCELRQCHLPPDYAQQECLCPGVWALSLSVNHRIANRIYAVGVCLPIVGWFRCGSSVPRKTGGITRLQRRRRAGNSRALQSLIWGPIMPAWRVAMKHCVRTRCRPARPGRFPLCHGRGRTRLPSLTRARTASMTHSSNMSQDP